jgi:hypothetical protein
LPRRAALGGTAQWAQRQQRTSGYTRQDWLRLRAERASIRPRPYAKSDCIMQSMMLK